LMKICFPFHQGIFWFFRDGDLDVTTTFFSKSFLLKEISPDERFKFKITNEYDMITIFLCLDPHHRRIMENKKYTIKIGNWECVKLSSLLWNYTFISRLKFDLDIPLVRVHKSNLLASAHPQYRWIKISFFCE